MKPNYSTSHQHEVQQMLWISVFLSIVLYLIYHLKGYTRSEITNPAITNYQLPITDPRDLPHITEKGYISLLRQIIFTLT